MRRYHREEMRHLNDSERYRDYDYLADDAWIGANERAPHGMTATDEPPWSTTGPWETAPFAASRALDEARGQGREYGRDLGLGYGRPNDPSRDFERSRGDDYDRGYSRPEHAGERLHYQGKMPAAAPSGALRTEARRGPRARLRGRRPVLRAVIGAVLHPAHTLRVLMRGAVGRRRWDPRIHDDVRDALDRDERVDASGIGVDVSAGVVTLRGVVTDRATRYRAEEIAADVRGVKDVHNRLHVRERTRDVVEMEAPPERGRGPVPPRRG